MAYRQAPPNPEWQPDVLNRHAAGESIRLINAIVVVNTFSTAHTLGKKTLVKEFTSRQRCGPFKPADSLPAAILAETAALKACAT